MAIVIIVPLLRNLDCASSNECLVPDAALLPPPPLTESLPSGQ
jgi:hypothetical protein